MTQWGDTMAWYGQEHRDSLIAATLSACESYSRLWLSKEGERLRGDAQTGLAALAAKPNAAAKKAYAKGNLPYHEAGITHQTLAARWMLDTSDEIDLLHRLAECFPTNDVRLKAQGRPRLGQISSHPDLRVAEGISAEVKLCKPTTQGNAAGDHSWPCSNKETRPNAKRVGIRKDFEWLLAQPAGTTRACVLFIPCSWVWPINKCIVLRNGQNAQALTESPFHSFAEAGQWTQAQRPLKYRGAIPSSTNHTVSLLGTSRAMRVAIVGPPVHTHHHGTAQTRAEQWVVWAAVYTRQ